MPRRSVGRPAAPKGVGSRAQTKQNRAAVLEYYLNYMQDWIRANPEHRAAAQAGMQRQMREWKGKTKPGRLG